jgi:predicted anti-sigma-YlaC factor YlaD
VESVTYTVTYVGQEILEESESPTMIDGMISVVETYWPILLGGFAVATLATVGGVIIVRKSKKNARNAGGM